MDSGEIVSKFVSFCQSLLVSKCVRISVDRDIITAGPCVFSDDWGSLMEPVTMDEVHAALLDIDNDKAPGSDGFGSLFFSSQLGTSLALILALIYLLLSKSSLSVGGY